MKKLLLLLACCLTAKSDIHAQADPYSGKTGFVLRTIESFGAIANDGVDDSEAFFKAARFFSNKDLTNWQMGDEDNYPGNPLTGSNRNVMYETQYGILELGEGIYSIGEQNVFNSSTATIYAKPKFQHLFQTLDGLIIKGKVDASGNVLTKINTKPGIYFGWFEASNATTPHPGKMHSAGGIEGRPPIALRIGSNANNVLVQNLELNGNVSTDSIGAPYNNTGDFNIAFSHGINAGGRFITYDNVYVHNFGGDGIYMTTSGNHDTSGRWNVTMSKVRCQWNGRHGLGWGSGRDAKIENSTFAYSGLREGVYDYSSSLILSPTIGSLSCNIDIETDAGAIRNGLFKNCKILGNAKGFSLVLNGHTTTTYVDSIGFDSCDIKGYVNANPTLGWAFGAIGLNGANGRNYNFTNCNIEGSIQLPAPAANIGTTQFKNCNIFGSNMKQYELDYAVIAGTENAIFDNCNITSQNRKAIFEIVQKSGLNTFNDPNKYIKVNNCNMTFQYNPDVHGTPISPGLAWFMRFTGNNTWTQVPVTGEHNTFMQCITVNGSSMFSPKNTFKFANGHANMAPNFGWIYDLDTLNNYRYPFIFGETPCEFLDVNLGDANGGSKFISLGRPVYIGEGVTFTVKSGSYLVLYDSIYLAGKIVVEPGGNLFFYSAKVFVRNDGIQHIVGNVGWADYSIVTVTNRSQLMAPQQFLKNGVNSAYYDSPNFNGCTKCYTQSNGSIECIAPISLLSSSIAINGFGKDILTNNDVILYPNPTNDKVKVHFTGEGKTIITLMDISGKVLQTLTSENAEEEISLQQYPAGTYLIKVSNSSTSTVKKVTKTD